MSCRGGPQWTSLDLDAELIVAVEMNRRKRQRNLRKFRFVFDCLDRASFIAAHQLEMAVNDHLGRINAAATKACGVCALSFTIFTGGIRILPSGIVPVI